MPAEIIDGKKIAAEIRNETLLETRELRSRTGITPGLAFILVGDNPASQAYVKMKGKACEEMGFFSITERLPATTSETELLTLVARFNLDPRIHGLLVQLPLPRQIREDHIVDAIDFHKDVDGFHPVNVGRLVTGQKCLRPCTPAGIQELLIRSGHDPAGKRVVILGRSNIVGKPIANILLQKEKGANAVVTIAHTGAADIGAVAREADILIVAIGKAGFLTGDMVKPGAVVIDVGINRLEDPAAKGGYRLVGDVDFPSVSRVAGALTPVPGGVGPMTIALLMRNTLLAAAGRLYAD